MKSQRQQTTDRVLEDIAKEHLRVATLETRKSDSLDFHDLAVWQLRAALDAAYQAGIVAAKREQQ
jgi:altronate dehydratase